jgi:hypothetical protein
VQRVRRGLCFSEDLLLDVALCSLEPLPKFEDRVGVTRAFGGKVVEMTKPVFSHGHGFERTTNEWRGMTTKVSPNTAFGVGAATQAETDVLLGNVTVPFRGLIRH